jgi:hypothetical protein
MMSPTKEILSRGGRLSYPIIIIDENKLMNGYYEDWLREVLDISFPYS